MEKRGRTPKMEMDRKKGDEHPSGDGNTNGDGNVNAGRNGKFRFGYVDESSG